MNPPWVTLDTSFLSPLCAVPKYYKFNLGILYLFLAFHLSFHQPTLNHHHLLSRTRQWSPNWSPVSHSGFPSSSSILQPQWSSQKTKLIMSTQLPLCPPPPLLGWRPMVQKTLAALLLWSPRPIWDPSHVPSSSHTTITLVLCDYSTLLEFSCPWTDHAPFQHRALECALFCYLCSSPDYIFTSQIKHLMRKPSLTSPMMDTISLSFAVLSTNLQCFQLFD